jgi:HlyD family secretion protein
VLSVPIQSVTTRLPKDAKTNAPPAEPGKNGKPDKAVKPVEVVFLLDGSRVKSVPVKRGISDDTHVEIIEGLSEEMDVVSGGYKAISRELEDGKRVKIGTEPAKTDK